MNGTTNTLPNGHPCTNGPMESSTNGFYYRTRTLPINMSQHHSCNDHQHHNNHHHQNNQHHHHQHQTQYDNNNNNNNQPLIVSISYRTLVATALSLLFVLIWSGVISGVLVTHSLREHEQAVNTADLFQLHKEVGSIAFQVGREMLYTLNITIGSFEHVHSMDQRTNDLNSIRKKWNRTDSTLKSVSQLLSTHGYLDFESDIQEQLIKLRGKCVDRIVQQWPQTNVSNMSMSNHIPPPPPPPTPPPFVSLIECVRSFEQSFHQLDTVLLKDFSWLGDNRHSKLTQTDLSIRNMPYTLFVRGIVRRFTTLGFGLIMVSSNFTHPVNMSEYLYHYFSSRQLIESSFVWNYRFLQKYLELDGSDYQSDMLLQCFDERRMQEHDFYVQMSSIFSRMFSIETLARIRSYIKKKNVETVERLLMVNGTDAHYVAEQDQNLLSIRLNTDLIEMMGLDNIERIMFNHDHLMNTIEQSHLKPSFDQLIRNQIGFMSRVQDFLNISISSHLTKATLNEQHNLLWHSVVSTLLSISSIISGLLLFCTVHKSRNPSRYGTSHNTQWANVRRRSTFGRRMRRRFWNLSPFTMFKSCFIRPFQSSSSSNCGATSPPRYPLLYKSGHVHCHRSCTATAPTTSSSPARNRFFSSPSNGPSPATNRKYNKISPPSYRMEKSITSSMGVNVPNQRSNASNSLARQMEAVDDNNRLMMTNHSNMIQQSLNDDVVDDDILPQCCVSQCSDANCPIDSDDPVSACSKCAATGKCATCCPYERDENDQRTTQCNNKIKETNHDNGGDDDDDETVSSKQSIDSSSELNNNIADGSEVKK